MAILAVLAIAISTMTTDLNNTISNTGRGSSSESAEGVSAAGSLILTMVFYYFIIYIGSEDDSIVIEILDSFGSISGLSTASSSFNKQSAFTASSQPFQVSAPITTPYNSTAPAPLSIPVNSSANSPTTTYPPAVIVTPASQSVKAPALTVTKATALYAYKRNVEDPNELSFEKGDIFKVLDSKGKWWKIESSIGEVGIAPSNYLAIV